MKLVYIATDPVTAFRLMDGQLRYMRESGFEVTVITGPGSLLERTASREGVESIAIPMKREIAPVSDAKALFSLTTTLRRLAPTIVNAGTPKAGLLGVVAARLARVPVVIYLLRGLRFEGTRGGKRLLLAATEHVAGGLADRVFANSKSLQARFVALGCAPSDKVWVAANGSSNGVEVERFVPDEARRAWAVAERRRVGVPEGALVVGFVGRFARDKGLLELLAAFELAARAEPRLQLLLVGDHDATDPLPAEVAHRILTDPRITTTGFVEEPAAYYALMNIFAFPSFREGFPNAPLEAAAAGLPVVAFEATGTVDAVVSHVTGTLVEAGNVDDLARSLLQYASDPQLARRHGLQGRAWVEQSFRREVVWEALAQEYRRLATSIT